MSLPDGWLRIAVARALFQLFADHGLEPFRNWITMQPDQLNREQLVEAAKIPEVLDDMQTWADMMRHRIAELEGIIKVTHATQSA
jgi:hypothetical protein